MTIKGMAASPLTHTITRHLGQYFAVLQKIPVGRWRQLCIIGLAFWLCHSLAELFWLVVPEPELTPPPPPTSRSAAKKPTSAAGIDIAALKATNLFGKASAEQKNAVAQTDPKIDTAVDTRLNLILRGIISSNSAKAARAIIAEGRKQELYAIGDELPAGRGVKLAKVLEQRVILNNNGRYESLWLFQEDDGAAKKRPSVSRTVKREAPRREPPPRVAVQQSAQSLTDVMKVSIVREGGKVVGYRIRPGRNREMFNNLGLKTNDVVTSVNGIALDSSSKAMEVYKSMKGKSTAQLELRRGDETVSVNVDLSSGEG